jgi:transposase InsO family protein
MPKPRKRSAGSGTGSPTRLHRVDSTPLDVAVTGSQRPLLTVVMDPYTRAIVGWNISYAEVPFVASV